MAEVEPEPSSCYFYSVLILLQILTSLTKYNTLIYHYKVSGQLVWLKKNYVLQPVLITSQELIVGTFPTPSFEIGHGRRIYPIEIGKRYKWSILLFSRESQLLNIYQCTPAYK